MDRDPRRRRQDRDRLEGTAITRGAPPDIRCPKLLAPVVERRHREWFSSALTRYRGRGGTAEDVVSAQGIPLARPAGYGAPPRSCGGPIEARSSSCMTDRPARGMPGNRLAVVERTTGYQDHIKLRRAHHRRTHRSTTRSEWRLAQSAEIDHPQKAGSRGASRSPFRREAADREAPAPG